MDGWIIDGRRDGCVFAGHTVYCRLYSVLSLQSLILWTWCKVFAEFLIVCCEINECMNEWVNLVSERWGKSDTRLGTLQHLSEVEAGQAVLEVLVVLVVPGGRLLSARSCSLQQPECDEDPAALCVCPDWHQPGSAPTPPTSTPHSPGHPALGGALRRPLLKIAQQQHSKILLLL